MNNAEIALLVGRLQAEVAAVKTTVGSIETKVTALVESNTLAKGGTKMLYKIGALCTTLGAGVATAATLTLKYLAP